MTREPADATMHQPSSTLAVEYAERSDPGRDPDKSINEDACGHRDTRFGHLCVVCDGMGGHAGGREASELALATIFEAFERAPDTSTPAQVLRSAIEQANQRVHGLRAGELVAGRPGSTVVAVLLHPHGTEVAHVGDSRAYLVHEGQIFRLTRDHSIVQELVDRGLLTPQQAAHHPEANRITRALGMTPEVEAELLAQPVSHVTGDAFVLCSDGLCDLVQDSEVLAIVGSEPAAQAVGKLVDLANARGGHDNVTVLVLRARQGANTAATALPTTVAQTSVTQAQAPAASAKPTVLEQPLARAADASRPLDPTPLPPRRPRSTSPNPRATPAVFVGLGLAAVAVALLIAVLLSEFAERGGKRNTAPWASGPGLPSADAAREGPTPLLPDTAPIPPPAAPGEPIPPLDPSAPPPRAPKH